MCRKYKLVCRNQCWHTCCIAASHRWQILSGLLVTDCWSFNIVATKCPKRSLSHTCGDSLTFTPFSKTVHQRTLLTRWMSFGLRDTWFYASMLLSADMMNIFISKPDKVHRRSRVAIDRTSWDKPVCTHSTLWLILLAEVCPLQVSFNFSYALMHFYLYVLFAWLLFHYVYVGRGNEVSRSVGQLCSCCKTLQTTQRLFHGCRLVMLSFVFVLDIFLLFFCSVVHCKIGTVKCVNLVCTPICLCT